MREKGIRTRERVLAAATEVFHRGGFAGTSVNDLIRETGVKKGNLYHYFSSKEEMGIEALNRARDDFFGFLGRSLQGDRPSIQLANHFDSILRYHKGRKLAGGCIFGNTALEMSDRNENYRAVIHGVFEEWRRRIRNVLEAAVRAGEVRSGIDPKTAARHVVATVEGGIMLARASRNADDLEQCLASLSEYLGLGGSR